MTYDFDGDPDPSAPPVGGHIVPMAPTDLEALVMLLECAVLVLSPKLDSTFTKDELFREAIDMAGPECPVQEKDLEIVLGMGMGHLVRKLPGGRYRQK